MVSSEEKQSDSEEDIDLSKEFEELYAHLDTLDKECSRFTRQFQDYRKQMDAQTFDEQEFYPKRHALSWFKHHKVQVPIRIEDFMTRYLQIESAKGRLCSEERAIRLGKQGRHLFQTDKEVVGWFELLGLLQNVFE